MTVSIETVIIGAITGLTYGLLGVGLVLVYRATRVVNFAYAQIGAVGATILAKLVVDQGWNWFVALLVVAALGGAIGAAVDLAVIRPLAGASRLVLFVATIAVFQVMLAVQLLLPGFDKPARYPTGLDRTMEIGNLVLRGEHFMALAIIPAIVAGLALLLQTTPYGRAINAAADHPDGAELAGISTRRISTQVWALTGVLVTVSAVLVSPLQGVTLGAQTLAAGPQLLLRALAAGLAGRLSSLPRTLAGGVVLGIGEAVVIANGSPATVDACLLVAVLALVLTVGRHETGTAEGGQSLAGRLAGRSVPSVSGQIRRRLTVGALIAAIALPLVASAPSDVFRFSLVAVYAVIALSITVLTGWAGQLSLGQFAFAGVGAVTTAYLTQRGVPFEIAVVQATIVGAVIALVVGAPALRVRGYFLAVTTLAFAIAARGWLFTRPALLDDQVTFAVVRDRFWFVDIGSERAYYYLCLAVLVGCLFSVGRVRRTGIGRRLIAIQENERAASALTISPAATKLLAFGLAGAIAALAGGLLGGLYVQFPPATFESDQSLVLLSIAIIGGLGSTAGAVAGAVYVVGLPVLLDPVLGSVLEGAELRLLLSGVGLLALLVKAPGGLVEVAATITRRVRGELTTAATVTVADEAPSKPAPAGFPLAVRDLSVRFGGVHALRGVDLELGPGEVVGLIGPNGAGKSTLIDAISGLTAPDGGSVEVAGRHLDGMPAHRRAHVVARTFQDGRLFPALTVSETVALALEVGERSELVPSMLALAPSRESEERKVAEVARLLGRFGLHDYASTPVAQLSTGTRRVVEIVTVVARGGGLVLLDEPTAGLSQRETEAFAPVLETLRREFGMSVLIVEHDMPLLMSICDRLCRLAAGEVIASGSPEDVRVDPAVIAAYLGTDERNIARSGATGKRSGRGAGRRGGGDVVLQVRDLDVSYGDLQILFGIDLEARAGEIVALLGTNGAGKSTVLRAVSGLAQIGRGEVTLRGVDVTTVPAADRSRRGIVQVMGGNGVFPSLSVRDNLLVGAQSFVFDHPRVRARIGDVLATFPELTTRLDQPARSLSGGEQQMLAMGKAMLLEPEVLLVDELSLGLAPIVVGRLLGVVESIRERGTAVVIVEQSLNLALDVADRAVFLEKGEVRFDGSTSALARRTDLARSIFLGSTVRS